jgi:hypothetical protein
MCVCVCYVKQAHEGRQCDDDEQDAAMTGKKQILPFFHPQTNKDRRRIFFPLFRVEARSGKIHILRFIAFCG